MRIDKDTKERENAGSAEEIRQRKELIAEKRIRDSEKNKNTMRSGGY